jgi:hypothetical protein
MCESTKGIHSENDDEYDYDYYSTKKLLSRILSKKITNVKTYTTILPGVLYGNIKSNLTSDGEYTNQVGCKTHS